MQALSDEILLSHEGQLEFDAINDMLNHLKFKLNELEPEMNIRRRIYSIMVECLENIYKHACSKKNEFFANETPKPKFEIKITGSEYLLQSSNLVSKSDKDLITKRIELINTLNRRELSRYYKEKISVASISDKGGAGLGLIEIARNSNRIQYDFKQVSSESWYFELSAFVEKKKIIETNMEPLLIEATEATPKIVFEPSRSNFEFDGCSRPENVREFYTPVLEWLERYKLVLKDGGSAEYQDNPLTFKFKLSYFNSSSAKFILDILMEINNYYIQGVNVKIDWYFEEGDEDMKDVGEELSDMVKFPFSYVMMKEAD